MAITGTEIERLIVRLIGDTAQYEAALERAKKVSEKASQALTTIGKKMTLAFTGPLTTLGVLATREFVSFEKSLSRIEGLVGISGREVANFGDQLKQLAPAVGRTPQDLAEGLFFVTSAGFRGAAAMDVLTQSAKAASAGLGDTLTVADAVTSAVNAYGADTLSAKKATEVLTAAVRAGKAEGASFAPVLGRILPIASALQVQFNEVGGVLAFLTKSSGDAAQAATGLRGILSAVAKDAPEIDRELERVELSMAAIRQQVKEQGLVATLQNLNKTLAEAGVPLSKVFRDVEAMNAVLQLTGPAANDANQVIKDVTNSTDIVDAAFAAWAKTADGQWSMAMANVRTSLIEIGTTITPIFLKVTTAVAGVTKWFNALDSETKNQIVSILALIAVLGPLLAVFGKLVSVVMASKASLYGLAAVGLAAVIKYAYDSAYATRQLNRELEKTRRLSGTFANMSQTRFAGNLRAAQEGSPEQQQANLAALRNEVQGSLDAINRTIETTKKEIASLESQSALGRLLDSHGIQLASANLEDATRRAELFKSQLERIDEATQAITDSQKQLAAETAMAMTVVPEQVTALMAKMETDIEAFGLTSRQGEILGLVRELEAKRVQIGDQQLKRLTQLDKELSTLEAMKKVEEEREQVYKTLAQRARQIALETLTPMQKLKMEIEEINQLVSVGALTAGTGAAAISKAIRDATGSTKTSTSAGSAVRAGSAEAYNLTTFGRTQKTSEKAILDMLAQTKVSVQTEKQILEAIRANKPIPEQLISIPGS